MKGRYQLLSSACLGTLEYRSVPHFSNARDLEARDRITAPRPGWLLVVVLSAAISFTFGLTESAWAQSSPRTSQLSKMLQNSDFRVRTQAAFSLGRLDDPNAVMALVNVLSDSHPAVRAAAAVALGRLGDPRALPHLRRHQDSSGAVRSQVDRAISMIEANGGGGGGRLEWTSAHHYLELDNVANVSKTKRPGLDDLIRSISLREMRRLSGIVAVDSQSRPPDVDTQIKRRRLPGYAVSVSLGRLVRYMGPEKVRVQAEVMLAVVTYPDRVYRMTANGTGAVTIPRPSFRQKQIGALQEDALSGAIQQAFRSLGKTLASNAASGGSSKGGAKVSKRRRR